MSEAVAIVRPESSSSREPGSVPTPRRERIGELDALRGIAAFAVVLHHLTRRFYEDYGAPPGALPAFPIYGVQGVFLFFIISGFVISYSLDRTTRARDFVVSRFSRLFPTFWTCVALTFVVVHAFHLPGREVGVPATLLNLTMLQDHFQAPQVDSVYWSLTIELSFYVIAGLAYAGGWLKRRPHAFAAAWLLFSTAVAISRRFWHYDLPEEAKLLSLPSYAPLFVAGILFHLLHAGRGRPGTHALLALSLMLHNALNWTGKTGLALSAGMFGTFYLVAYGRLTFLRTRPMLFLGAISYPLYLLHNNIGIVAIRAEMSAGMSYVLSLIGAVLIVVALSAAVTAFVERPAMRWIRGRFANAPAPA